LCSLFLGLASAAAAQPPAGPSPDTHPATFDIAALTPAQDAQLTAWLSGMEKWQKYDEKWRNRPVHDGWARIVERRLPPEAPAWLGAYCESIAAAHMLGFDVRTEQACHLSDDPRAHLDPSLAAASAAGEQAPHSAFLTRIHIDGLWSTTSSGGRFYGIIGSHISLVDVGRLQVFGPPGVMLLTEPNGHGGRSVTIGYTWGLSLRLADLRLNAPTKNMTLFLNVSKVFVAAGANEGQSTRGYDIVGFSLAPRKKR
jgi:hypothetical protein